MKRHILLVICIAVGMTVAAQNSTEQILEMVAADSPRLKAAAEAMKASQAGNAGIRAIDAPEFEYGMLWGSDNIGQRNDISVKQSFDIATISGKKSGLVTGLNMEPSLLYKAELTEVLYDARILLADIVYYNGLIETLKAYEKAMELLHSKTERSLDEGEATAMDMGKVKLQLSSARTATSMAVTERAALIERLRAISGHQEADFTDTAFGCDMPMEDFETWLGIAVESSPLMQYAESRVKNGELQLDIDRMAWVPKLDVGYMAELARDEKYRGVTIGLSVPLWSNSMNVRRSRAAVNQAKADSDWQRQMLLTQATNAWNRAHSLGDIASESQTALERSDTRALLDRALEEGELSVLDYLLELGMYYDAVKENLHVQQKYHHAISDLIRFNTPE